MPDNSEFDRRPKTIQEQHLMCLCGCFMNLHNKDGICMGLYNDGIVVACECRKARLAKIIVRFEQGDNFEILL